MDPGSDWIRIVLHGECLLWRGEAYLGLPGGLGVIIDKEIEAWHSVNPLKAEEPESKNCNILQCSTTTTTSLVYLHLSLIWLQHEYRTKWAQYNMSNAFLRLCPTYLRRGHSLGGHSFRLEAYERGLKQRAKAQELDFLPNLANFPVAKVVTSVTCAVWPPQIATYGEATEGLLVLLHPKLSAFSVLPWKLKQYQCNRMWSSEVLSLNTACMLCTRKLDCIIQKEYQLKQVSQANARLQETWWSWARDDHILQALAFSGMFLACCHLQTMGGGSSLGLWADLTQLPWTFSCPTHGFWLGTLLEVRHQSADSWRQVGFMRGLNVWTMSTTRLGLAMKRTCGICRIFGVDELWRTTQNKLEQETITFFPNIFHQNFLRMYRVGCVAAGHMWCLLHVCCPRLPLRSALHRWDQGRFDIFIHSGCLNGVYICLYT